MASLVVPGSRLHPPRITMTAVTTAPKLHDEVAKPGSKLPFKNELMIAYCTTWKATEIKGKVIAHPTKRQLRIQWTIGEKPYVSEHGMAFLHLLSVPASYVQDRAEQIIRPTHSEVEEGRGFWQRKRWKLRSRKTRMLMK